MLNNKYQKEVLDNLIKENVECITHGNNISEQELLSISNEIYYLFSRTIGTIIGNPNYNKLRIITGILDNMKQELYSRTIDHCEKNGD